VLFAAHRFEGKTTAVMHEEIPTAFGKPSKHADKLRREFERVLDELLGTQVRASEHSAIELWCALSNIAWISPAGDEVIQSFRLAGEIVADIAQEGDYMTWYCSGEPGEVAAWISDAMATQGWTWRKR
jgi:hypothetical protein